MNDKEKIATDINVGHKEIEEMAKDLKLIKSLQASDIYTANYQEAKALFSLGYRKIPEGAVVIPKKITEETNAETLIKIAKYNERVRKETAREFAVFIKSKLFDLGNIVTERDVDDMLRDFRNEN